MRKAMGLALAAAAALAGCKALGFHESQDRDFSANVTAAGTTLEAAGQRVQVVSFRQDFKADPPQVVVTLKNEGPPIDLFSADVEFGYPVPPDSFAPYDPDFSSIDIADFGAGKTVEDLPIPAPATRTGKPLFARVVIPEGTQVRMTAPRESSSRGLRHGSILLAGKVEVVDMAANLTPPDGQKPTLSFTIEHVDSRNPDTPIEGMRYIVQFFGQDGKLVDLGRRFYSLKPVGKNLGKLGETATFEVGGLDAVQGLAGSQPVLRLTQ
jgi:hypothetical protein